MKRVLSLFIILTITLSVFGGCAFLPDEIKICTVNFYVDNELYDTKTGFIGQSISMSSAPQKENLIFMGWYSSGLLGHEFDSSSTLTGNVDLHAYYIIDAISLTDMLMQETIKSIVSIENKSYNVMSESSVEGNFQISQGSGVVIDISGGYCYVLTNNHVVEKAEGLSKQAFTVEDPWGNKYDAQIYKNPSKSYYAMSEEHDLALLYFKYSPTKSITLEEIQIAESSPKQNNYVAALGTPDGLQNAISYGTVLAYQPINADENSSLNNLKFDVLIHDAYLNHGSSGGALVNMSGELVGINFAGYNQGMYGCAIPIDKVLEFMDLYVY